VDIEPRRSDVHTGGSEPGQRALRLRLPGAFVTIRGPVPADVAAALSDLTDPRLHLDPGAARVDLTVDRLERSWRIRSGSASPILVPALITGDGEGDLLDAIVGCLDRVAFDVDPSRLHLRGAVVELDGIGVLLAGPPGSGKSTVALELVRRGASYLTDERVTVQSGSSTVYGYPKPVTLTAGSLEHLAASPIVAELPVARTGRAHVRAGAVGAVRPFTRIGVVVTIRHDTAADASVRPLSPAEACARLLEDSSNGARMGPSSLDVVAPLVASATSWELTYRDAAEAADLIAELRPALRAELCVPGPEHVAGPEASEDPAGFALPGTALGGIEHLRALTSTNVADSVEGRCTGVLAEQVVRGRPCVEPQVAEQVRRRHHAAQSTCALLERELPRLVDVLEVAGVQPVVLKGPVSAHDGALPPHLRDFGDLDLLVPANQMPTAVTALTGAGFERCFAQVSPEFDRRFVKSVTMRTSFSGDWSDRDAPTFEVDLHRTLTPGPYGELVPLDELHARSVPVRVHDRWYRALHPTHRFLHHCLHVVLGSPEPRLHSLRDLVLSAPRTPAGVDEVIATAGTWGVTGVVQRAVGLGEARFPESMVPELVDGVAAARPHPIERLYLASYHRPGRSYSLPAVATLVALPSWRDRADLATMLVRHRRSRDRE
jgi:hypothetical protein